MEGEKLKELCWAVAKCCLKEDEQVHGIAHVKRVYKNFELLRGSSSIISEEILKSLECAVILHDIGFRDGPDCHALRSVFILMKEFPEIFFQLPNKEWIQYAIENHSTGKKDDEGFLNSEKTCLDLLMVLDHMDALGEEGLKRDFRDLSFTIPLIPLDKKYTEKEVENIFQACGFETTRKNISILDRLLSNGYYFEKNRKRVESYVATDFINIYIGEKQV